MVKYIIYGNANTRIMADIRFDNAIMKGNLENLMHMADRLELIFKSKELPQCQIRRHTHAYNIIKGNLEFVESVLRSLGDSTEVMQSKSIGGVKC